LRKSFELGIASGKEWVAMVDADLILAPNSINKLVREISSRDESVFEVQGYILDRFFCGLRRGGLRVYRSSLLPVALDCIPDSDLSIRPEADTLVAMRQRRYTWAYSKTITGLHDYEQNFSDILRKSLVYGVKHRLLAQMFEGIWSGQTDRDYVVAGLGFSEGLKRETLKVEKFSDWTFEVMSAIDLKEKSAINEAPLVENVGRLIENYEPSIEYLIHFPTHDGFLTVPQSLKFIIKSHSTGKIVTGCLRLFLKRARLKISRWLRFSFCD